MLLLALLTACTSSPSTPAEDLAWLVGTWQTQASTVITEERWHALPSGQLLGTGAVRSERMLLFAETMAVHDEAAGRVFTAWPTAQDPTAFALVLSGPQEVAFENREHDFPQRITYKRTEEGLHVEAKGVNKDGGEKVESWKLTPKP